MALSPLCGYDISTRRRRRIAKTNSPKTNCEGEFPEDEFPPNTNCEDEFPKDELPPKTNCPPKTNSEDELPPEDEFPPNTN